MCSSDRQVSGPVSGFCGVSVRSRSSAPKPRIRLWNSAVRPGSVSMSTPWVSRSARTHRSTRVVLRSACAGRPARSAREVRAVAPGSGRNSRYRKTGRSGSSNLMSRGGQLPSAALHPWVASAVNTVRSDMFAADWAGGGDSSRSFPVRTWPSSHHSAQTGLSGRIRCRLLRRARSLPNSLSPSMWPRPVLRTGTAFIPVRPCPTKMYESASGLGSGRSPLSRSLSTPGSPSYRSV